MIVARASGRIEPADAWRVRGWSTRQVSTYRTVDLVGCDGEASSGGDPEWTARAQPRIVAAAADVPVDATELVLERLLNVSVEGPAPELRPSASSWSWCSGPLGAGTLDDRSMQQATGTIVAVNCLFAW